jgi:phage terminase large subunit-like protein
MAEKTKAEIEQELFRLKKQKELQEEINKARAELEYRKKNFSIRYYAVRYDLDARKWVSRGAHKSQDACHRDKSLIRVASGGNRCIAGETVIYDPVKKCSLQVKDIDGPFHVLAWDGLKMVVAEAGTPFIKGEADLYEVSLSNGEKLVCTEKHQVLTKNGYKEVGELKAKREHLLSSGEWRQGYEPYPLGTIWDTCQSVHGEDGQSSLKIVQDYLFGCLYGFRFCGGQLLRAVSSVLDVVPLRVCVQGCNDQSGFPFFGRSGGRENKRGCIHSCQLSSHPSSRGDRDQIEGQFFDILYRAVCRPCRRALRLLQVVDRSKLVSFLRRSTGEFAQRASLSGIFAYDPPLEVNAQYVSVTSINYLRFGVYYDLTVPGYGNYLAAGIINHNSGKSTFGINEGVSHALGYRPWLPEGDPDRKINVRLPNKGLVCGESFGEQIAKVLVPKLLGDPEKGLPGAIPTDELSGVKRNPTGVVTSIFLKNGSAIYLQSYDQDIDLFESADYDWCHFDEPPPRPIWVAVQRGLTDRRGRTWLTMTPLKEPWIYDEIFSRDDVGLYYFDIEENVGFGLTREGVDNFSKNLTDDEKEARLRGKYFHLSGLVYKNYGPKLRLKRFPIPKHWGLWFHVDTHPRTPHHAVWMAVDPDGRKYVCGELKNGDTANSVKPFIEAVKVYEKTMFDRKPDEVVRLIEPGSQAPDPLRDGRSICDEFTEQGLRCRPGSKNRDSGILLFQQELRNDPTYGVAPNIFFFNDLEGVHFEMMHYMWDDWNRKAGEGKTEKQAPKDRYDHFIEGIHRILLDEPFCDGSGEKDDEPYEQKKSTASKVTGY